MKVLVTGGLGFIGSAVIRHLINETDHTVVNIDKVGYASSFGAVAAVADDPRYEFVRADITDTDTVEEMVAAASPDAILHLAAESHVDRSIDGPRLFVDTNVIGTLNLLQAARSQASRVGDRGPRFIHVSTDEVFGSLQPDDGPFTAATPYSPRSPYSASKAASDHLVRAWGETYGLHTVVCNCSNNYGWFQFPEKLIPLMVVRGVEGKSLPVYGDGANVRDWLFVDDHARGLVAAMERGHNGGTYLFGGGSERSNMQVVEKICDALDATVSRPPAGGHRTLIEFVTDRPGHDFRYAVDYSWAAQELQWEPSYTFDEGIERTVDWYLANESWWRPILDGTYDTARLGQGVG